LIATASLSAAMKKYDVGGKIILFGTPAEEGGGGKIKMLDAGAYEGVDVNLMSHPGNKSDNALVCTAAFQAFKVEYFGKAAHAAASPWEGVSFFYYRDIFRCANAARSMPLMHFDSRLCLEILFKE